MFQFKIMLCRIWHIMYQSLDKIGPITVDNNEDYMKIIEWFEQQGSQVMIPAMAEEVPVEVSNMPDIKKSDQVTRENIKKFKQKEEYRNVAKEEKWVIDCEARNENMVYINAKGQVFPCSYIARDILENRLYPLHPIDYPYNPKYNNAKSFPLKEIVYNADFECYNDSLKKDHLKICKETCGRCV